HIERLVARVQHQYLLQDSQKVAPQAALTTWTSPAKASLATPTWRTSGLGPGVRVSPVCNQRAGFVYLDLARQGVACDADLEDVRAWPGRPGKPGLQQRDGFVYRDLAHQAVACHPALNDVPA